MIKFRTIMMQNQAKFWNAIQMGLEERHSKNTDWRFLQRNKLSRIEAQEASEACYKQARKLMEIEE